MRVISNIILFSGMLCSAVSWSAGRLENVVVTEVWANKNGMGVVRFESVLNNSASCSTGHYKNSVAIDLSTYGGRTMESIALAALASGNKVTVQGTGDCILDPNTIEDASYIHIKK